MKQINTYINEKLRLTTKQKYTCQPKDKYELKKIIIDRIKEDGNECDLNDIDTSKIIDMSLLFDADGNEIFKEFNGDISQWDVSNVKNMYAMFYRCEKFNCDISKWNVSNVRDMGSMFSECEQFNSDISHWNISNVKNMTYMFWGCKKFNQNLDSWDVSNVTTMYKTFLNCPTQPTWYDEDKQG